MRVRARPHGAARAQQADGHGQAARCRRLSITYVVVTYVILLVPVVGR